MGLINKNTAKVLSAWLDKWNIPYDEILYGKPWPGHKGFYVDDRTVRPDEFLNCSVDELNEICSKSKCKIERKKLYGYYNYNGWLGESFSESGI